MNKESSSWAIILGIFLQNRPTTASFLFYFCSFQQLFTEKYILQQDLNLNLGVESKHTDNLTTTTTAQIGIFV